MSGKLNRKVWISITRFIFTWVLKHLIESAIVFCFVSSADVDWYHEVPAFPSPYNKSEPTWEWGDEQGFSALRHSGETETSSIILLSLVWSPVSTSQVLELKMCTTLGPHIDLFSKHLGKKMNIHAT